MGALKYLIGYCNGARILFMVLPEEEESLRESLKTQDARIFICGNWEESLKFQHKLSRWIKKVDRWVITHQQVESQIIGSMICEAHITGTTVSALQSFLLEIAPLVSTSPKRLIHLLATQSVNQNFSLKVYSRTKSVLEPLAAVLLFLFLLPVMTVVAFLVKLTSPGPVIYSQERMGKNHRIFRIYKFRSMKVDAEKAGPVWAQASRKDPMLTPIGGFLRATHLDELPQFWNIICGDVSFIGPRPERPEFVKQLTERFPFFSLRALVKPGITGWAQVHQGYVNSMNDSLRKLELDLFYIMKYSWALDLKIAVRTFSVLISGGTEAIQRGRALRVKA